MTKQAIAICQPWLESESGWGVRPDGYSLHKTKSDLDAYVQKYWDSMPDEAPSEYSRPCGNMFLCVIDEQTKKELDASENGIRSFSNITPGEYIHQKELKTING